MAKPKTITNKELRQALLEAGVRNLKEFGYPKVSTDNIISDRVYRGFFRSMLNDNMGQGADDAILGLIEECDSADLQASSGMPNG